MRYKPGSLFDYTYDADGMRTKRTNGTDTYTYVYNGSQLTQMTKGSDTLYFTYDAEGKPSTVTYDGVTYYYVTNLQGDVTGILLSTGQKVVTYTYDAWGRQLSCTGSMASTIGTLNPLRYRGYVYDQETSLYYLQSRYYNPEIGRFINADGHTTTGQGFVGNNMFAYCGNNPVNRADSLGNSWIVIATGIAVGAVVGVTTSWIASLVTNQEFTWRDAGIAALSGGISSLGTAGLIVGSLINGVYSGYTAYENGASWGGVLASSGVSVVFSLVSFGDLAQADTLVSTAISGFTDLVFGTGFSSMDAAVSKSFVEKNQKSVPFKNNAHVLDIIKQKRIMSNTRIYNGRAVTVSFGRCSYPSGFSHKARGMYCLDRLF